MSPSPSIGLNTSDKPTRSISAPITRYIRLVPFFALVLSLAGPINIATTAATTVVIEIIAPDLPALIPTTVVKK